MLCKGKHIESILITANFFKNQMTKHLFVFITLKIFLLVPIRGQSQFPLAHAISKDFTIVEKIEGRDSIIYHYDKENRLVRSYKNNFIFESIKYVPQDTVVVADLLLPVAPFSNAQFTYNFEEADTILLDIYSLKRKKIRRKDCKKNLLFFDENTKTLVANNTTLCEGFLHQEKFIIDEDKSKKKKIKQVEFIATDGSLSAIKKRQINWTYLVKKAGNHYLKINNFLTLNKRSLYVKVTRIPKSVPVVTKYARDTIELTQIQKYYTYDTLLTTILEEKLYLPPLLNIESTPFSILNFNIPADADAWTYWTGVGEESAEAFAKLEETIPDIWSKPGASKTLSAYTTEQKIILPNYVSPQVKMAFGSSRQMQRVQQKINQREYSLPSVPAFQKNLPAPRNKEQYLLLFNQDKVNGQTIYVKIIATQIVAEQQEKEVIRYELSAPQPVKDK